MSEPLFPDATFPALRADLSLVAKAFAEVTDGAA
jgi:hypothetical protein